MLLLGAQPAWAGGPAGSTPAAPSTATGQEQSRVVGTPTLTARERAAAARKDAALVTAREAGRLRSSAVSGRTATVPLPVHKSIKAIRQTPQARTYWCGPATLTTLVQADGRAISQQTAARYLKTTRNGTNWYSGGGNYPMERTLERYSGGFDYTPQNLAYTPSARDMQLFKTRLMTDIAVHNQGIAGNAVEVRNGPHLNGHPNRTIYHWIAVRGYDDNGETTRYADPVAGSSISWSAPVPRYAEIDTDTIVTIFGARGYIW